MNFNRKSNENYISSKSGDFAQQGAHYVERSLKFIQYHTTLNKSLF